MLDVSAAIMGLALIMVLVGPAGDLFNIPPDQQDEMRLYGFSIVAMVLAATPLGVLRLLDRFDLVAIQTTIAPAIRLAGTLYLFVMGGGLVGFLVVWFAAAVVSRIVLLAMAWGQFVFYRSYEADRIRPAGCNPALSRSHPDFGGTL